MGLKPLKVEGGTTEEREAKERAAGKAREEERRRKTEAAELRERIETWACVACFCPELVHVCTADTPCATKHVCCRSAPLQRLGK